MTQTNLNKIKDLDVFELFVFKYIFEHKHANNVAKLLNVSAPKVSRSLSNLRNTFDDELFYRRQAELKPTPVANGLYDSICEFCRIVEKLETPVTPAQATQEEQVLHIAVPQILFTGIARSLKHAQDQGRITKVRLHSWHENTADDIYNGKLDFGVGFENALSKELTIAPLGHLQALCVVGAEDHPIWSQHENVRLEHLTEYPFIYIAEAGFNDKIDPFELYCRNHGLTPAKIESVSRREEWYSHMLNMGSLSFLTPVEADFYKDVPSIHTERLLDKDYFSLHGRQHGPMLHFIETQKQYRHYNSKQREAIADVIRHAIITKPH
ncbi:LysR family transcriptional regulator [Shewanella sp. WXL01]|uniref:LysR family transcriptional regulator n=1 Tax=Shewanella maritima TaxID=2520507 RepID=A0A411PH42_9GAMM|nr:MULTISPECIES: LysR family transcriptional regulator [Shewanella]NKF49204.1 LysR family transcriptional regulator [Shewanella sp. WXL01]QBF82680.1 LysR family transcriptional regulator [Shewanella maritima]